MGLSRYVVTVPANSERDLNVTGAWVYVVAASALFELGVDQGATGQVEAGTYWEPARPFRLVRIRNTTGAVNTVELKIGDGYFEDRRGEGGGAAGIEPADLGSIKAYAYRGQRTNQPGAGNYGHLQLYNPAASGVLGVVRRIYLHSDVGGQLVLFDHNTQLADNFGGLNQSRSAYFGQPNGKLRWFRQNQATKITVSAGATTNIMTARVTADGFVQLPFDSPLVLPPGWGLVVRHDELGPLDYDVGADILELPDS